MPKNKACNVILFMDFHPFRSGGMETHGKEFINFFKKSKNEKLRMVVAFNEDLPNNACVKHNYHGVALLVFSKSAVYSSDFLFKKIGEVLKEEQGHAVLFFNSMYWIRLFPEFRKKFPLIKICLRSGGNDILHANLLDKGKLLATRHRYIKDIINRYVDCLIVNSTFSRKRFSLLGIKNSLMSVVKGGVEPKKKFIPVSNTTKQQIRNKLKLPQDKIIILTACRLVPVKNVPLALRAVSQIKENNFVYVVVGSGPEFDNVKRQIDILEIQEKVLMVGDVDFDKINQYYQASDIYLQTSCGVRTKVPGGYYVHTETMGRSFCEASAVGLPVVSTDTGGVPEIVRQGLFGFLFKPNQIDAMAKSLEKLILDTSMRKRRGREARKHALEKFDWRLVFNKYVKIFHESSNNNR